MTITFLPSWQQAPEPVTFETRLAHVTVEEYFAEPCAVPALSASIAHVLESESPLHAWARHPKLGSIKRPTTKALDNGSLSHALLLGAGKDIEIIDAADYRTNAAKDARDAARLEGKIPVLGADYEEAEKKAEAIRLRFAEAGIVLGGESEVAAFWTEAAPSGAVVQCRAMIDHLDLPTVYDIKSIRSANPVQCRKHIEDYGYAIQRAAYVSAIETIRPELAGRVDFVFVFYELEPPHAVTPLRLSGAFRELGDRGWRRAVRRWEECLRTNVWPSYVDGIREIEPSKWALERDLEKGAA